MPPSKLDDPFRPEAIKSDSFKSESFKSESILNEKSRDSQITKSTSMPPKPQPLPVSRLSKPDSLILRLDRLLAPAKDLGSVLSTFNYSLYILAYLDAKLKIFVKKAFKPAEQDVIVTVTQSAARGFSTLEDESPFARLASVVDSTRMTLRLFGLLPIYVKMRKLMQGPIGGMDSLLHTISVIQCALYAAFQLFENLAFLTESGVLAQRLTHGLTKKTGHVTALYKIAHRAWFLSVVCDFVRLFRLGQLVVSGQGAQAIVSSDKTQLNGAPAGVTPSPLPAKTPSGWFPKWVRPVAWLPIAWQLSAWSEEDVPGLHMGVRGVAGMLADLGTTMTLWDATADVQV